MFEISRADFDKLQAINVYGVFFTMREAAAHMTERGATGDSGGSLVSVASTAAIYGAARNEYYGATKEAVVSTTHAMAAELAPHGIRANSILPGWTRSDMTERLQGWDKFNDSVICRVPLSRWGSGDDFSAIAVYLASGRSSFLGDAIVIDGGYTIY